MGLAVSLIIAAAGLILALAVHPTHPGSVDVNTVGWILFIVGLIGFLIDLLLWSSWGPGYARRRSAYVDDGVAYPARRAYYAPRRRVVEEVDEPAGPPPGY
jgi:Domain of unknown function (DUF6458)